MRYLVIVMVLSACSTVQSGEAASERIDPQFRWMAGAWDCRTNWFAPANSPFKDPHVSLATYVVADDGHGALRGEYRELSADGRPLVNFDDVWRIGSILDSGGDVPFDYEIAMEDGSTVAASGRIHGPAANGVIRGFIDGEGSAGQLDFPDGDTRRWHGSSIGIAANRTQPITLTASWRIPISPTTDQVYFSTLCSLRAN